MIKKILPVILCLCLMFSISAMAANSTDNSDTQTPAVSEEMPKQGGGRQGGMGVPPGDAMSNGETPPAMPGGEMTPPQPSENTGTESGQQTQSSNSENTEDTTDTTNENSNRMQRGGMGGGMGGMNGGMPGNTQTTENTETASQSEIIGLIKTYSTPITAVILLALAFVFVIFYKRKNY